MDTVINWLSAAIVYGTVLAAPALGETINEKTGHLNLGVPGIMYLAGFISYYSVKMYLNTGSNNSFMIALIALLSSFAIGAIFGLIYSVMCVTFKANQNVVGLAISAFGVGFGKFFSTMLDVGNEALTDAGAVFNTGIIGLRDIPYAGQLLFSHGFFTYMMLIILILAFFFFKKTRVGLNLRAIGESPAAADSAGISVTRYKYLATTIGCGFCGLGGMAYVFQFSSGNWGTNNNMETIGWLAIALVIFATWNSLNLIWCAPLFGFLYWASTYLQHIVDITFFSGMNQILQMLPYIVTILILIINSLRRKKESQPPSNLGLSYFREER